ncbi:vitamin K epoxide reductase family protein [Candidatus Uhrbacteria bacterium]|mgnify:FL=1|jgi:vitamin-K-epoxide reductase (warfarin-sensitive)|nr:vitamin K epoxide reductase family protein [Candidatus Uhrbacteria bacterium]
MKDKCSQPICDAGSSAVDRLTSLIAVSAVVGVLVSIYSALAHYGSAPTGFCKINETFDCDLVNQSAYSEIFGIPVSIMGIAAYVVIFVGIMMYAQNQSRKLLDLLLILGAGGLVFSLYLTGIEAFVLHTWCLLCLASQAAILIIAGSLYKLQKK